MTSTPASFSYRWAESTRGGRSHRGGDPYKCIGETSGALIACWRPKPATVRLRTEVGEECLQDDTVEVSIDRPVIVLLPNRRLGDRQPQQELVQRLIDAQPTLQAVSRPLERIRLLCTSASHSDLLKKQSDGEIFVSAIAHASLEFGAGDTRTTLQQHHRLSPIRKVIAVLEVRRKLKLGSSHR